MYFVAFFLAQQLHKVGHDEAFLVLIHNGIPFLIIAALLLVYKNLGVFGKRVERFSSCAGRFAEFDTALDGGAPAVDGRTVGYGRRGGRLLRLRDGSITQHLIGFFRRDLADHVFFDKALYAVDLTVVPYFILIVDQ